MSEVTTPVESTPRRGRTLRIVAVVVGVIAAAFIAVLATRQPTEVGQAASPLLGQPAPQIDGASLDGQPVSLASLQGHYVLVNFFASWCGPCHTELPNLVALARAHPDLKVIGVAFNDSSTSASGFLASGGAEWPAVADPDEHIALSYGVRAPPESYLVDPEGMVVAKIIGGIDQTRVRSIEDYLSGGGSR
ncbi:MAG TPA: TlpA disulfide reductase family protein [Acidimicrobiales bacterium]|nr:TlpA disulfide reductase family protein [Acidimicrobiales bacterium]